jgi:hypothetical protein
MAANSILLINPPLSKPSEPPAGIARLAKVLAAGGIPVRVWDASIEGVLALLDSAQPAPDAWSQRAFRNRGLNLKALRSAKLYLSLDRYKRAVKDLNRALNTSGRHCKTDISLSNYSHRTLSPLRSADLIRSARQYHENPFHTWFRRRIESIFTDFEPDIIGFSVNFIGQALTAFAMTGFIHQRFPDIRVVMGGGLISSWRAVPGFTNPFKGLVDDLIAGPGEAALLSICKGRIDQDFPAVGYDFDPFPMQRYLSPGSILPVSTASGCWWRRCAFCPEKAEGGVYRPLPPGVILEEVHGLVDRLAPVLIHFLDNALSPRFLKRLIDSPPGVPWYGFVRITDHLADPDFVTKLKASGCRLLKLGIESGDQGVLDAMQKGIRLDTVSKALKTLERTGIAVYAYLLFGTPAEDIESARKTLAFTLAHAACIDFLNLAIFNLPAHSPEAKGLETSAFFHGDLSLYHNFQHPKGWHRKLVRLFLEKEFKKNEVIRNILANDPPFFTSNHAPFFAQTGSKRLRL